VDRASGSANRRAYLDGGDALVAFPLPLLAGFPRFRTRGDPVASLVSSRLFAALDSPPRVDALGAGGDVGVQIVTLLFDLLNLR